MLLKETPCFKTSEKRELNLNYEEITKILMEACPNSDLTKHW
jgi:hypothetical protein